MKTVLVAGGSGFIGRHSLQPLIDRGYRVHSADLNLLADAPVGVKQHQANLFDPLEVRELISEVKPTHLLNFAWITKHGEYWSSMENLVSLTGSIKLLEAFAEAGGRRVVMAGTCAEYSWKNGACIENATRLEPSTLYGSAKLAMYEIIKSYSRIKGLSWGWGRVFFTFGPYENPARFVPSIIKPLLNGKYAPCSHGNQIRDFLFSADIGEAFAALTDCDVQGAVNVASGRPVSLKQVVSVIEKLTYSKGIVKFGEIKAAADEAPVIIASTCRLLNEVNWSPKFLIEARLAESVNWWKNHV